MRRSIAQFKEGIYSGVVSVHSGLTMRFGEPSRLIKRAWMVAGFSAPMVSAATAFAATTSGCQTASGTATGDLYGFINRFSELLIGFGAVGSILMLCVGAGFIMFAGGNEGRARKGMGIVRHVVIGLMIFAGGFFIKYVVLEFVAGASGFNETSCIQESSTSLAGVSN